MDGGTFLAPAPGVSLATAGVAVAVAVAPMVPTEEDLKAAEAVDAAQTST